MDSSLIKKISIVKRRFALMLFSALTAHGCIADCLYGNCEQGLGIQTSQRAFSQEVKETYVGDFANGERTGCATISNNDSIYFGQVVDSKRHGLGTLIDTSTGKLKEGRWVKDRFKETMTIKLDDLCPLYGSSLQNE